jgi:hypothetical protein
MDQRRGPITRVMLAFDFWDEHPLRLAVGGRVIRLGWFASMPVGLLTAIRADRRACGPSRRAARHQRRARCEPKNNGNPRYLHYSNAVSNLLWLIGDLQAEQD